MTENAPSLEIINMTRAFAGRVVIDDFSLRLQRGDKATLSGPSGCGKSTVLRCLLGFDIPDRGEIRVESRALKPGSVWSIRRRIASVAQEPVLGDGTVRQVLERPFQYRANEGLKKNLVRAPELFERFFLTSDLMDKDVTSLSGGEKQRVGLIVALMLDRPIMLLDEATSALDQVSKGAVNEFFAEQKELTILSVSHDPTGLTFSDNIILMAGGAANGLPSETATLSAVAAGA